jgi:hypothetical protein
MEHGPYETSTRCFLLFVKIAPTSKFPTGG